MLSYDNRPGGMAPPTPPDASDILSMTAQKPNSITSSVNTTGSYPASNYHHIWLITGPAGCGKSTVAQFIAKSMNLPYIEGDEVSLSSLLTPTTY